MRPKTTPTLHSANTALRQTAGPNSTIPL